MTCSIDGCDRPKKTRGMCGAHAERARKGRPMEPPIAGRKVPFEEFYVVSDGCWEWLGSISTAGYGRHGRKYAHRVSYERHVGPIPQGMTIDHLCRNTVCVNPAHLEAVTMRVNMLRGIAPAANATRTNRCKRGHEFTPENTFTRLLATGYTSRICRACSRLRGQARRAAA